MWLSRISLVFPVACVVALGVLAADRAFTSYASVKPVLDQPSDLLPAELRNPTEAKWSVWSQRQDKAIRARLQQGDLDSMVNLLLYGTSFTKQPRIKVEALTEASKAGILRARVDDLVAGLRNPGDNERLTFLNGLLRSQGIDPSSPGETGVFIYNNLGRVIQEIGILAKRGEEAKRLTQPAQPDAVPDPAAIFNWRAGLFQERGVSLDTGIFPNFSIEQALRDLKNRGVLREGQVARVAVRGGAALVLGVDPTWGQLVVAGERGGGPVYARAAAARLPVRRGMFDAAVACLVFEHIEDYAEAIGEVARALRPGGRFLFFLNHPLLQTPGSGWIDDHILEEQYWRVGPYLADDNSPEEVAPGVLLPFIHRPLSRYVNAMADHGLLIERMEEPAPPPGFLERAPEYREAATIPRLLFLVARKQAD